MQDHYILGNAIVTDGFSFLLDEGAIEIENKKIKAIGKSKELKKEGLEFIDLDGRLILPGLLNPHHHLYSALATGLSPIGKTDSFKKILENLWWHLDQKLDEESIYYSAMHGLMDSIQYGVTTIFDHHASMKYVDSSLQIIKRAFQETGVKGLLCFEISDRMGKEQVQNQLEENINFFEEHKNYQQVQGLLGLHANFTLSEKTLQLIANLKPDELPIHIHCGEGKSDLEFCQKQGYEGPVDRLYRHGLLDNKSLLAHCIHLSKKDYKLLNDIEPIVISNPESNANNNVGRLNLGRINKYVLGTDGMTGNILGTMRTHFLMRNAELPHPKKILFEYPGQIIDNFFPTAGKLQKGKAADLAITNYKPVTDINLDNLFYHLIFGVEGQKMYMTISNGKILYKNGQFSNLDQSKIHQKVKSAAQKLHRKFYE
ncbi:MAG TPA: amidohydrolase family protein [bacterium]|nr:amidohydrolase family protein [bacterium]